MSASITYKKYFWSFLIRISCLVSFYRSTEPFSSLFVLPPVLAGPGYPPVAHNIKLVSLEALGRQISQCDQIYFIIAKWAKIFEHIKAYFNHTL